MHAGGVVTEASRCAALCAARPSVVITGLTASRLWSIRSVPLDDLVHVLAPPHSKPCSEPWVKPYRTEVLSGEDVVTRRDGIRLTSPPRTVVGLARYLDDRDMALVIEFALADGVCSLASLRRVVDRLDNKARPWVRTFRSMLEARAVGGPCESTWELRVVEALRARGITDLETQRREDLEGRGPVRFDVAISDIMWVVEIDVHPWHETAEGSSSDRCRDVHSRRVGWQIERVRKPELVANFEGVMDELAESIKLRRAQVDALRRARAWPPVIP